VRPKTVGCPHARGSKGAKVEVVVVVIVDVVVVGVVAIGISEERFEATDEHLTTAMSVNVTLSAKGAPNSPARVTFIRFPVED